VISSAKLTKREKFNLRLDKLPADTIVNVVILTGKEGEITSWSIGNYEKLERARDVTERIEE
jgi:hypothetical protein